MGKIDDTVKTVILIASLDEIEDLRHIVEQWVDEGFTTPPYKDTYYDIFEALGVESTQYDVKRP